MFVFFFFKSHECGPYYIVIGLLILFVADRVAASWTLNLIQMRTYRKLGWLCPTWVTLVSDTTNLFTFGKQTDMFLIYGAVNGNSVAVVRRYYENFPSQRTPNGKTFEKIKRRLRDRGHAKTYTTECRRTRISTNCNCNCITTNTKRLSIRFFNQCTTIIAQIKTVAN